MINKINERAERSSSEIRCEEEGDDKEGGEGGWGVWGGVGGGGLSPLSPLLYETLERFLIQQLTFRSMDGHTALFGQTTGAKSHSFSCSLHDIEQVVIKTLYYTKHVYLL